MFDAQAYFKSLDPPVFVDPTGKRHVGQIIGADTWLRMQTRLRSPIRPDGTTDSVALTKAMRAVIKSFFPHPWYRFWEKSVLDWMWELPPVARMRAIWDFMQSQANAMGVLTTSPLGTSPTSTLPQAENPHGPQTSGSSQDSMTPIPVSTTSGAVAG